MQQFNINKQTRDDDEKTWKSKCIFIVNFLNGYSPHVTFLIASNFAFLSYICRCCHRCRCWLSSLPMLLPSTPTLSAFCLSNTVYLIANFSMRFCVLWWLFSTRKKTISFFSSRAQFSCPSEIVNALKKTVRLFNSDSKAIQFIHICLYTDGVKVHISKLRIHMEIVCSVNNMLAIYYTFQINNENMYIVATLITFPLKNNCYYAYRERSQIKALQQLRMQKSGKSTHMLMTLEPKHHMLLRCNFSHLFS